jgi:hypothetical protein
MQNVVVMDIAVCTVSEKVKQKLRNVSHHWNADNLQKLSVSI